MENQILIVILIISGGISIGLSYALSTLPQTGYPDNVTIGLGNKLYLDGGNNTYLQMPYQNTIRAYAGGTAMMDVALNGIHYYGNLYVLQGNKLYLDGGGNNYIQIPSSNQVALFSNGVQTLTANNGSVGIDTSNPQQALDVAGNIRTTGNITAATTKEFRITTSNNVPICIGTGC